MPKKKEDKSNSGIELEGYILSDPLIYEPFRFPLFCNKTTKKQKGNGKTNNKHLRKKPGGSFEDECGNAYRNCCLTRVYACRVLDFGS